MTDRQEEDVSSLQEDHLIKRIESEEQRNALFQVVEDLRARIKDCTKNSLKLA